MYPSSSRSIPIAAANTAAAIASQGRRTPTWGSPPVTTLDGGLARKMEPRASTPARRLGALATLVKAGVPAGVMVAPIIPGLNDNEIELVLKAAAATGIATAGYVLLRLPLEVRDI